MRGYEERRGKGHPSGLSEGKLRQEDDQEGDGAERDRRWHWQTKCHDPAAPKLSLKDLKAGITAGQKQGLVTGGEVLFFSRHLQRETTRNREGNCKGSKRQSR